MPHPLHHLGENLGRAPHVVAAIAPVETAVIARELQCRGQHAVALIPVPEKRVPRIVRPVLQEDAQRLRLVLAHDGLQVVAAAHGHKRAHAAEHAPEQVGPVPGSGEGGDAAAAQPEDHVVVAARRDAQLSPVGHPGGQGMGQQLLVKESGKCTIGHVKLVAAVVADDLALSVADDTRLEENADGDRHLAGSHEAVHHRRGVAQHAVQPHIEAGGRLSVILVGDIDLIGACGAGIDADAIIGASVCPINHDVPAPRHDGAQQAQCCCNRVFHFSSEFCPPKTAAVTATLLFPL